jgi:signal peptidase I
LPLDSLRLRSGCLYLNDKLFSEPYLAQGTQTQSSDGREHLIMIGKDRYFVLGDNRNISEDSRYYGSVRREQIIGLIRD